MPAVLFLTTNGCQYPRRFSCFENADDLIGFGALEVGIQEFIPACSGIIDDGHVPVLGPVLGPVVKLRRNLTQDITGDRIQLAVRVEKSDDAFRLLKRLNDPIQQNAIEASVMKTDVILMVLVESVHD